MNTHRFNDIIEGIKQVDRVINGAESYDLDRVLFLPLLMYPNPEEIIIKFAETKAHISEDILFDFIISRINDSPFPVIPLFKFSTGITVMFPNSKTLMDVYVNTVDFSINTNDSVDLNTYLMREKLYASRLPEFQFIKERFNGLESLDSIIKEFNELYDSK